MGYLEFNYTHSEQIHFGHLYLWTDQHLLLFPSHNWYWLCLIRFATSKENLITFASPHFSSWPSHSWLTQYNLHPQTDSLRRRLTKSNRSNLVHLHWVPAPSTNYNSIFRCTPRTPFLVCLQRSMINWAPMNGKYPTSLPVFHRPLACDSNCFSIWPWGAASTASTRIGKDFIWPQRAPSRDK